MESGIVLNHHDHKSRSINSCFYHKTFVQLPRRTHQRLIPLTLSIRKLMMDFNTSPSNTSISEKEDYKSISITKLVRKEVQNILEDLSISEQFIRKEEIDELMERCLREHVVILEENDLKLSTSEHKDIEQKEKPEVKAAEEKDLNKLIVENVQILEYRITSLEERLSTLLQTIPKLKQLKAKQFKINANVLEEIIQSTMEKIINNINIKEEQTEEVLSSLAEHNAKPQIEMVTTPLELKMTEPNIDKQTTPLDKEFSKEFLLNIYDELFYKRREYCINLLNYKKSQETIKLNEKSIFNPYVKPCHEELPPLKRRPMFLTTNGV